QRAQRREQEASAAYDQARSACSDKLNKQPISSLYPLHLFRISYADDPRVIPDYGVAREFKDIVRGEHWKIEDLGQYPDESSLCAVRRSFDRDMPLVIENERRYKLHWLAPQENLRGTGY